jgi:uncharacterized protein (TIGR02246 family)
MRMHSTSIVHSTRVARGGQLLRRNAVLSGAALGMALLFGGCGSAAPTEAPVVARPLTSSGPSASAGAAFDGVGAPQGDEAGVEAVATAWDAAWNAGDASALAALFVDDAEFINGRGQLAIGAAAIRAQHAASLAGPFRGSHTAGHIRRITFLSGTTAVLDVDNELTGFAALPPGTVATSPGLQRGRHKRVLVKRAGTWRIVLMQITTVAPAS